MQKTVLLFAGLSAFALGVVACSPKTEEPKTEPSTSMGDMKMDDVSKTDATTVPAGPITAVGKITAIDAASGAVTLDHGPIPAVNWDAMTMAFAAADPMMLKDLKVGDAVSFELKSAVEKTIIVRIQKQ
ncbi:MAG: copper-binding protein [Hyphomonadaceae bacterium]|nr:copper-binding protein [Hyphomonadaceae bacterium]